MDKFSITSSKLVDFNTKFAVWGAQIKVNVTEVVNQNITLEISRDPLDIFLGSGHTPSNVKLKRFHPMANSISRFAQHFTQHREL